MTDKERSQHGDGMSLPPLPVICRDDTEHGVEYVTADHARAYAAAAVAAEREACAILADESDDADEASRRIRRRGEL